MKSTTTLTGYFRVEQAGYFQFGNTAVTACAGQTAHVDEFRISRGILPPEKFIRQVAEPGMMVIIR